MQMHRERWQRIEALFERVIALPSEERKVALRNACEGDPDLYHEIQALLDADDRQTATAGLPASGPDERIGQQIGPYTLLREIGRGGMGVVFVAGRRDESFERRVALKLLRYRVLSEETRWRFARERRILARLEHPNIARLLDGGIADDGTPYLVLELVDGVPIDRWCRDRKVPFRQRVELFGTVCAAVAAAHRSLVVHQDLKPGNLLIREDGQPKLLDFGISELLDSDWRPLASPDRLRPFTPGYASPEQISGDPISRASDVFSLGVVLHELITGELPPAQGSGAGEALELAPPPRLRESWFREDLDAVLRKALAPEPTQRYASAAELAADIHRFLNHRPVEASAPGLGRRMLLFAARHRRQAVAGGALAILALGLGVAVITLAVQRGQQRDQLRERLASALKTTGFLTQVFEAAGSFEGESRLGELLAQEAEYLLARLEIDSYERAKLAVTIGRVLTTLGRFEEARPLLEEAVRMLRAQVPEQALELAVAEHALAQLLGKVGDYDQAEALERSALKRLNPAAPDQAVQRVTCLSHLGGLLTLMGKYAEAEEILGQAITLARSTLGENSPELADALAERAFLLVEVGRLEEGRRVYRAALEIFRERLGPSHPTVAMTMKNLATADSEIGDDPSALRNLEGALQIEKETLGSTHPSTAGTLDKLAVVRIRQGELQTAAELIEEALALRRQAFGDLHPRVAETLGRLAELHRARGDLEAAAQAYAESVEVARLSMPAGSAMLAFPLEFYASVEIQRGRPERAEPLLREALELRQAGLPAENPLVVRTREALADCLEAQGRVREAELVLAAASPKAHGTFDLDETMR